LHRLLWLWLWGADGAGSGVDGDISYHRLAVVAGVFDIDGLPVVFKANSPIGRGRNVIIAFIIILLLLATAHELTSA
jgi:hypothetical protein